MSFHINIQNIMHILAQYATNSFFANNQDSLYSENNAQKSLAIKIGSFVIQTFIIYTITECHSSDSFSGFAGKKNITVFYKQRILVLSEINYQVLINGLIKKYIYVRYTTL